MGLAEHELYAKRAYAPGPTNLITDVPGVKVGHADVRLGGSQTGVTVLIPTDDNIFMRKRAAACHVINGFGKSQGLVQIDELGTLETPIVLTNTLAVGACWEAIARYMVSRNPTIKSVNPVVMECNDGSLNDIRTFHVTQAMCLEALDAASSRFEEGAVGAGRGMICHGLSGGIGSASRLLPIGDKVYTMGALLLTNHGRLRDLTIYGDPVGERLTAPRAAATEDKGSAIVLLATDLPLSAWNLKRLSRRAVIGLGRVGGQIGHASGEIVLAFSTANIVRHAATTPFFTVKDVTNAHIDDVFRAAIECVEEAVISSLWHAETVVGLGGYTVQGLRDLIHG